MTQVDARGFSCPEPLIRTRDALKTLPEGENLEVLVDTVTSRENVRRYVLTKGFNIDVEDHQDGFKIIISK